MSNESIVSSCSWAAYYYNVLGDSQAAIALCDEIFATSDVKLFDEVVERIAQIYEQHSQKDKTTEICEMLKIQ